MWLHSSRYHRVSITYLAVVAAVARCALSACIKFAGRCVAAGILAFLGGRRRGAEYYEKVSFACFGYVCVCVSAAYLYSATVTLLSRLQEGVSTHWPSVDAISGGSIQQTGRVDLLQESAELLLTAAAEQLWIHNTKRISRKNKKNIALFWVEE